MVDEPTPRHDGARGAGPDALFGRLIDGRYRIGPRIARGGMASVYEATDIRLDKTVAVKVMHVGLGDHDEFAARFVREARAAARIDHPHVVAVYDQGDDDGTVFLAMEYVPGHTLRDVIRKESPMAPRRALETLEPVVSAIAAAHRAGLIHRDVKPENVLIADSGQIKVADFGLAKAISTDTQHTVTGGVLIGTVSYLAPEMVVQDVGPDARADVYALGVVLFELLTGSKPHAGESPIQVAYKHVNADIPAPSSQVPGVPAYVDALVARATARDRALRPADAGILLHQMHRVMQALTEGVDDDPELTADLRGALGRQDTVELAEPEYDDEPVALVEAELSDAAPIDADADHPGGTLVAADPAPPPASSSTGLDVVSGSALAGSPPGAVAVRPTPIDAVNARRPRGRWRGPLGVVLAVLLVAGLGVGAWWLTDGRWTRTPGVLELTADEAADKLEAAGLTAERAEDEYSETVEEGLVISTYPAAGDRVLAGGTVSYVISLGKERYRVPKLAGETVDDAQDRLMRRHLTPTDTIERWHESVGDGRVIRTDPKAGTSLRPDTAVTLIVSKGRKPLTIGDWIGKSAARAESQLTDRGLVADTSATAHSDSVPKGNVISQQPRPGTTLHRGDTVQLVVSLGPELIEVPRVVASGVADARERLEGLGFEVRVVEADSYIGLGYVLSTNPSAGTMLAKGSTVTLYLV